MSKVYRESLLLQKLGQKCRVALFIDDSRLEIPLKEVKRMLDDQKFPQKLKMVQFLNQCALGPRITVIYKSGRYRCRSKMAKGIAKSLVTMVEHLEGTKVVNMAIEMVTDQASNLWISNVKPLILMKRCNRSAMLESFESIKKKNQSNTAKSSNHYHSGRGN